MRARGRLLVVLGFVLAFLALGAPPAETAGKTLTGTVEQLLGLDEGPFAIGHRGFGESRGQDPTRPIENTVPAVRAGFRAGVSVVEVDVQLTRDGEVAVFHDDFLPDFTCLNRLTLTELQARLPHVPSLQAVLNQARQFNQGSGPLQGLVVVELKAAAPLCDPHDTQEQAIVSAVVRVIRQKRMAAQVMLASFSPALLFLAAGEAPEIPRILTISGLQFLEPEQVQALLGLPVTPIEKDLHVGLQWAEIGPVFRLPGYLGPTPKDQVAQALLTAAIIGARGIEADLFFFSLLLTFGGPDAAQGFVGAVHGLGLKAFGWTANTAGEWLFLESLGVDAIYTNDVPLGVHLQAPIP